MGYLEDGEVATLLEEAKKLPEVASAVDEFVAAWSQAGLPPTAVDAKFVGAVFVDSEEEPLLPEDARKRAADPTLFQLVWLDPEEAGLALETFDDQAAAETKLESLGPDEFGEGGGILFKGGENVKEKLFLKHMQKEDFAEFLQRATAEPAAAAGPDQEAKMGALVETLTDRLRELTRLAPEIARLHAEYQAKGAEKPEPVYGKPSPALQEFARLFPEYVVLGGCVPPS